MKSWLKFPKDGDNAKTCRSQVIERIYGLYNWVFLGVTKVINIA
jgi:hypothetical protein